MRRNHAWRARTSVVALVGILCLGLMLAGPQFESAYAADAVNIGPSDALDSLEALVLGLPDSSFKGNSRSTLLNKIDAVCNQIEAGAFRGATRKMTHDLKAHIAKWVKASDQTALLEKADILIAAIDNAAATAVTTAYGRLVGMDAGNGSYVWKGIPYAKPPVGALRWKAPRDAEPWSGIKEATVPCSECWQHNVDSYWRSDGTFKGSEDCLYLDIYRPKAAGSNLPVYFYIHGGSNNFGSAKQYNGSVLADRGNMIVIYVQYRLTALGWLTHPALRAGAATSEDASGNYGTLDHIKALIWVKNNIAAFGGDPNKVTIGGQSAGAHNSVNLVMSPKGADLFRGAFVQSAAMDLYPFSAGDDWTNKMIDWMLVQDGLVVPPDTAATVRGRMTNAQIEAYLRGKSAETILRARRDSATGNGTMPTNRSYRDGVVLQDATWLQSIAAGNYTKVPIVFGSTRYEWKDFSALYGLAVKPYGVPSGTYSWLNLFNVIGVPTATYPGPLTLNDVLPTGRDKTIYETVNDLKSRGWTAAYVDTLAKAFKTNDVNNTVYGFNFRWNGGGDPARADFAQIFGAAHSMDIPFFQGRSADAWNYSFTQANAPGRIDLQNAMMDYLIAFVKTGDPNPAGSPLLYWPQWDNAAGGSKVITFDANQTEKLLGIKTTEESVTAAEIAALQTSYPETAALCYIFGIAPVVP